MKYNFDNLLSRLNTNSIKWDYRKEIFDADDVLPLWVADMDFACPPGVTEALMRRAQHPAYGYPGTPRALYEAAVRWTARRFGRELQPEWMTVVSGVVPGLYAAVEAFTSPGDKVIVQPPVYPPFYSAALGRGRRIVENPLVEKDGHYRMDIEGLRKVIDERTKLLILCSPHNPVGRVWSQEELRELAALCAEKDLIVLADEIHADLVYEPYVHTPFYSLGEDAANRCVTFLSPSKTFNVAGLFTSLAVAQNSELLKKLKAAIEKVGVDHVNLFGIEACIAAYDKGEEWLDELLVYLLGNAKYIEQSLAEHIPGVRMKVPEATYLGWLDFRGLGLSDTELKQFIIEQARLGLNDGHTFGRGGQGFQRLNFGCSRATLEEALGRLETAVNNR
ncbi:MalY/PatB family protein [Aneurinibacillus sp. REN35]|uniref:MalY/PatB family protein n=1 Tax=Aneurinibacillus sp. REN35 TaxID=3237286 RepID=UPI003528C81C